MAEPRILVVEDDPVILDLLTCNFELEGYTVLQAADGDQGIERSRRDQPDVIVSDIMMPKRSGLDLLSAVRADHSTSHIPVVLLSVRTQEDDVRGGLGAGADDYVTKPFEPGELLQRVDALLGR